VRYTKRIYHTLRVAVCYAIPRSPFGPCTRRLPSYRGEIGLESERRLCAAIFSVARDPFWRIGPSYTLDGRCCMLTRTSSPRRAGDPAALERLLSQLRPDIQRYARFQCCASSSIEDVVQEA